ncbi:MAG TPA: cytochrome d ubiquinol oxidase subunit II [bacterium]|nr:cytochrome d ubiquinol oxidase subunit II [bacterium]
MLGNLWYALLALMLAAYVVLDGFDLGAGALLPLVARTPEERGLVVQSLGPVWDGNEVWLLAAGGTLVLAFPRVYAAAFSGFYLPLMLVLWLLVFRALSIELRHQAEKTLWLPLCDIAFAASSLLLAVILGAALGNVVRGVDADAEGHFFHALFTDFSAKPPLGILDWYSVLAGLASATALARHGALWLNWKTAGPLQKRSALWAGRLGPALAALVSGLTAATLWVQPLVGQALATRPWLWVLAAAAVAALGFSHWALGRGREGAAFLGSALFLACLLGCAAAGLYPVLLPAAGAGQSLTVANSASADYALRTGLDWWLPGLGLAIAYFVFLYRGLPRKFNGH